VLDLRPPRLLPWCEPLYPHERRLLPLFQLFAEEQAGEAATDDRRDEYTPVTAKEFSYLGASWPAMAAFLNRHDLAPR
jgi:hypothetical protein